MKTISIAGNVGKDAEVRRTQDGTAVASWSVGVDDRAAREKATIWFDVSMWGARGEKLANYITKGTRVAVSGDLGTREYNGKTYLTVRADQVTLLGGGERREDALLEDAYSPPPNAPAGDIDDEIPF
jgi:single-strand DNA-binding protein